MLRHVNVWDHVCDPPPHGAAYEPRNIPSHQPVLLPGHPPEALVQYNAWWRADGLASHILLSRVSPAAQRLIPNVINLTSATSVTARTTWNSMFGLFSGGDWGTSTAVRERLQTMVCSPGRVLSYVSAWRSGLNTLNSAAFPMPMRDIHYYFFRGIPMTFAFNHLLIIRSFVYEFLNDNDPAAIPEAEVIFERVIAADIAHSQTALITTPRQQRNSVPHSTPISSDTPPSAPTAPPNRPRQNGQSAEQPPRPVCSNCKYTGHTIQQCYQPGGGNVGGGPVRRQQAHMGDATEVIGVEEAIDPHSSDDIEPPGFAALSVSDSQNADLLFTCYPHVANVGVNANTPLADFMEAEGPTAFASFLRNFHTILDSGCTTHIFSERRAFWTYHLDGATSVTTANAGALEAHARGEIRVRVTCTSGKAIVLRLTNCLHAPTVPMNLVSVGAFIDKGILVDFKADPPNAASSSSSFIPTTTIHFHPSLPAVGGLSFLATVKRRLSFLNFEFIYPPSPADPVVGNPVTAMPVFPKVRLTPELWHRRFGHANMDVTRAILTKDYATGVKWEGAFEHTHCIPCIVGKTPQRPFVGSGT